MLQLFSRHGSKQRRRESLATDLTRYMKVQLLCILLQGKRLRSAKNLNFTVDEPVIFFFYIRCCSSSNTQHINKSQPAESALPHVPVKIRICCLPNYYHSSIFTVKGSESDEL